MQIDKYYEREGKSGSVIAIEIVLRPGQSIYRICFPDLAVRQGLQDLDINIESLKRIFAGSQGSIQRNGTRPSYRILLDNDVELYANSLTVVPEIDSGVIGLKENVLHIGIPGPLIHQSSGRCVPIFKSIESFFIRDRNLIALAEKEKSRGRRVMLAVCLICFLALSFFLLKK